MPTTSGDQLHQVTIEETATQVTIDNVDTPVTIAQETVSIITAASQGPPGGAGPQGPQGPAGATTGDLRYTYTQSVPSSNWTIMHNLGKIPSVTVVDSGGSVNVGEITYTSLNSLTIDFGGAEFAGTAYLN